MEENFYAQEKMQEQGVTGESIGRYTAKTFLTMFLGLLVTFGVAFFGYATGAIIYVFYIPMFHVVLLVAELAVVLGMTAILNGIVFSAYFLIFEIPSLILVFAATSLYFGGMAVFGYVTHIDLSRIRTVLLGGLIFLIVMNLLMMFIPGLQVMDQVICTVGLILFLAYTAYDTQKIKAFYQAYSGDAVMLKKASIYSALQLYLDFVNMFLYVLRIFGKRKN